MYEKEIHLSLLCYYVTGNINYYILYYEDDVGYRVN